MAGQQQQDNEEIHIRTHHIPLEKVQQLNIKPLNQIYVLDLNQNYLQENEPQIDNRIPWDEIKGIHSQVIQSPNNSLTSPQNSTSLQSPKIPSRVSGIIDVTLKHQFKKNRLVSKIQIFGICGKQLLLLFSTENLQEEMIEEELEVIKNTIDEHTTSEPSDIASGLSLFIQETQNFIKSNPQSYLETFLFLGGGFFFSKEIENKCFELCTALGRATATSQVSISHRVSDLSASQASFKRMLGLTSKDLYCTDLAQIQYFSWLEIEYMECLLDVVQSKKINKYEETAISLAAYHEDHPNTLESLQRYTLTANIAEEKHIFFANIQKIISFFSSLPSLFKVCQEVSGDLPTEENKEKERKELVEVNLKGLFQINDKVGVVSFAHPKVSLQQALYLKKMLLQLLYCGTALEDERYQYQQKAQGLVFEREDVGKSFSECMFALKQSSDFKLEVFNSEMLLTDMNSHSGYLLECVKQDLLFTKKLFEICKEINTKIFIFRKNVEKCNQKDLSEFIDGQLVRIQAVQFKILRNIENSVSRLFLSLQQTLDVILLQLPSLKINTRRKAVFDELTNLIRANSEYQTYLTSGSEGTSLGQSFKFLIETYFKDFMK